MSRTRPSSLSRTNSALRNSSAIAVIRSFAALNSASSRSIATSRSAAKHSTLLWPLYDFSSLSCSGPGACPLEFAAARYGEAELVLGIVRQFRDQQAPPIG